MSDQIVRAVSAIFDRVSIFATLIKDNLKSNSKQLVRMRGIYQRISIGRQADGRSIIRRRIRNARQCVAHCRAFLAFKICDAKTKKGVFPKTEKYRFSNRKFVLFCCAENADDVRAFAIKKRTLHLTLLVECSVLYFIEKKFRFMIGVN